jgi:hypothetical protein
MAGAKLYISRIMHAEQASKEMDSARLMKLVEKLCQALDSKLHNPRDSSEKSTPGIALTGDWRGQQCNPQG